MDDYDADAWLEDDDFDAWLEDDQAAVPEPKPEPVKPIVKRAEPKKVEPKKAEPKKVEPKKAEPKKVELKKAEPKKAEPKKAVPAKPVAKKTIPEKPKFEAQTPEPAKTISKFTLPAKPESRIEKARAKPAVIPQVTKPAPVVTEEEDSGDAWLDGDDQADAWLADEPSIEPPPALPQDTPEAPPPATVPETAAKQDDTLLASTEGGKNLEAPAGLDDAHNISPAPPNVVDAAPNLVEPEVAEVEEAWPADEETNTVAGAQPSGADGNQGLTAVEEPSLLTKEKANDEASITEALPVENPPATAEDSWLVEEGSEPQPSTERSTAIQGLGANVGEGEALAEPKQSHVDPPVIPADLEETEEPLTAAHQVSLLAQPVVPSVTPIVEDVRSPTVEEIIPDIVKDAAPEVIVAQEEHTPQHTRVDMLATPEDARHTSELVTESPDDSAAWLAEEPGEDADPWLAEESQQQSEELKPAEETHSVIETPDENTLAWAAGEPQVESHDSWLSHSDDVVLGAPMDSLFPGDSPAPAADDTDVDPIISDSTKPEARKSTIDSQVEHTERLPETVGSGHTESAVQPETTFAQDQDGDSAWDLHRTDSDAFSFLPPSNRTNSFPAVPPVNQAAEKGPAGPLPSSQALEFLEEMEKEAELDEADYKMRSPKADGTASWQRHGPSHSLGGQVDEPESAAAESRFEEGLPLISPEPEYPTAEQVSPGTQDIKDPFAEGGEQDEFFAQTQSSADVENLPPIQRKSTLQFTGSLDNNFSRRSTVDETVTEEPEPTPGEEPLVSVSREDDNDQPPVSMAAETPVKVIPEAQYHTQDTAKWDETFTEGEESPFKSEVQPEGEQFLNDAPASESNDAGGAYPEVPVTTGEILEPEELRGADLTADAAASTDDTSKWAQAFADDDGDDFLPEEVDAAIPAAPDGPQDSEVAQLPDANESAETSEAPATANWQQSFEEGETDFPVTAEVDPKLEQPLEHANDASAAAPAALEPAPTDDLSSKWEQAFGGDDGDDANDFLEDSAAGTSFDAAAFLGSDDEGLLEDEPVVPEPGPAPAPKVGTYAPSNVPTQQPATTPYAPGAMHVAPAFSQQQATAPGPGQFGQTPSLPRTDAPKAQSFADKAKGGYASPYDLPTGLVRQHVRPRRSMQQLQPDATALPPRGHGAASGTLQAHAGAPPPLAQKTSTPALRSKSSFFEELPMPSKPRPSSRHSNRAPSPSQYAPPPPHAQQMPPPPASSRAVPPPQAKPATAAHQAQDVDQPGTSPTSPSMPNLVQPEKVNPYAGIQSQSHSMTPPSSNSSRYSPAPVPHAGAQSAPPPGAASSRYSPAPSGSRPGSSAGHGSMPHLPRTSSPLAHFDSSAGVDGHHLAERRTSSSSFDPRLNRVASLPPTREVDEEDETAAPPVPHSSHAQVRYSPAATGAHTPPPPPATQTLGAPASPSRRQASNYLPQAAVPTQPPRAQSQSPDATRATALPAGLGPRSASVTHQTGRPRKPSVKLNMVPPTDGREHDSLERWKGAPILTWGVGGVTVTSFPKSIPRYAMNQTAPTIVRTVGEVKVQNIKDLDPLAEKLSKFPGPLRGKSKKKEAVSWLSAGIEAMEKDIPDVPFHANLSLEAKRSAERLLLWKLLRVFIEHDGTLEGNPAVEKAVREVLAPETTSAEAAPNNDRSFGISATTAMNADGVDAATMEKIRLDLLRGDRAAAVWAAVDKRLWGHAMLVAQTVSPDLYKQVAQEFVRKEVNYPGHRNESLAALYKVLSGNFDDCVDELVPSHARAGLQLLSTDAHTGATGDVLDGLDKWRETLTLVLSNRSTEDVRGLNALGKLLSSYGRAEAAQICFIFSRSVSKFGGLDDPNADFVLVGSDHHRQSEQFAKETEALQLSEVYEYGLTLGGGVATTAGAPHLAAYKLQHAIVLAEYGFRDKALQYCDTIATAIVSQTRRSPYHHPLLEASVEDFMTRLKQAPKDVSASGWMSKPSMNKVSDSMWNRFNKFVSGDEEGNGHPGSDADNGPFARIGSSPNISRPPSTNTFDMYGGGSPGYGNMGQVQPVANTNAGSRYAPAPTSSGPASVTAHAPAPHAALSNGHPTPYAPAQYAPAGLPVTTTSARNSHEYTRNSYEQSNQGSSPAHTGSYAPTYTPESPAYQADAYPSPMNDQQQAESVQVQTSLDDQPAEEPVQGYQPPSYGYAPPELTPDTSADTSADVIADTAVDSGAPSGGFEPPSLQPYGYEPPSYQPPSYEPDAESADQESKPKKKSFMDDDDDDDIPGLRKPQGKSNEEEDREKEEKARKEKEEEAKKTAEAQPAKRGWGFGGWFGAGKKDESIGDSNSGKAIKAKLGEESTFVYDPDLKRWINKKPGAENVEVKKPAPPPPRAMPRSASSGTPPPPGGLSRPPTSGGLPAAASMENLGAGAVNMARSESANSLGQRPSSAAGPVGPPGPLGSSRPPSRPATSMSNASSIDDLIGAPSARKGAKGGKKPRKAGRYVDVMAK